MAKLWDKGFDVNEKIERFTVGKDRELDLYLAPFDVLGTMAHITMLESVGLLAGDELDALLKELRSLYDIAVGGGFSIEGEERIIFNGTEAVLKLMSDWKAPSIFSKVLYFHCNDFISEHLISLYRELVAKLTIVEVPDTHTGFCLDFEDRWCNFTVNHTLKFLSDN